MRGHPDIARGFAAEQIFPHLGVHAVGADDDIGIHRRSVLEHEADGVAGLVERDQTMIERDRAGRHALLQHRVQVAAVDVGIGTAEPGLLSASKSILYMVSPVSQARLT